MPTVQVAQAVTPMEQAVTLMPMVVNPLEQAATPMRQMQYCKSLSQSM